MYRLICRTLMAVCCLLITAVSQAQVYDAATDFAAQNPNGVWSYGWSETLGSPFILDTVYDADRFGVGIEGWYGERSSDGNPSVLHNPTGNTINA